MEQKQTPISLETAIERDQPILSPKEELIRRADEQVQRAQNQSKKNAGNTVPMLEKAIKMYKQSYGGQPLFSRIQPGLVEQLLEMGDLEKSVEVYLTVALTFKELAEIGCKINSQEYSYLEKKWDFIEAAARLMVKFGKKKKNAEKLLQAADVYEEIGIKKIKGKIDGYYLGLSNDAKLEAIKYISPHYADKICNIYLEIAENYRRMKDYESAVTTLDFAYHYQNNQLEKAWRLDQKVTLIQTILSNEKIMKTVNAREGCEENGVHTRGHYVSTAKLAINEALKIATKYKKTNSHDSWETLKADELIKDIKQKKTEVDRLRF